MIVLTVNLLFTTLVFAIAAKLYLLPRLPDLAPAEHRTAAMGEIEQIEQGDQ